MAFSVGHFRWLLATSTQLNLSAVDTIRFLRSYYEGRLSAADHEKLLTLHVKCNGKVCPIHLRPNATDYKLVNELFLERSYETGMAGVKTILDLGANIGLSGVYLAARYPDASIACVEPDPGNVTVLQ